MWIESLLSLLPTPVCEGLLLMRHSDWQAEDASSFQPGRMLEGCPEMPTGP